MLWSEQKSTLGVGAQRGLRQQPLTRDTGCQTGRIQASSWGTVKDHSHEPSLQPLLALRCCGDCCSHGSQKFWKREPHNFSLRSSSCSFQRDWKALPEGGKCQRHFQGFPTTPHQKALKPRGRGQGLLGTRPETTVTSISSSAQL